MFEVIASVKSGAIIALLSSIDMPPCSSVVGHKYGINMGMITTQQSHMKIMPVSLGLHSDNGLYQEL